MVGTIASSAHTGDTLTGDKTNGAKSQPITVGTTDALITCAVTGEFLEKPVVTLGTAVGGTSA